MEFRIKQDESREHEPDNIIIIKLENNGYKIKCQYKKNTDCFRYYAWYIEINTIERLINVMNIFNNIMLIKDIETGEFAIMIHDKYGGSLV